MWLFLASDCLFFGSFIATYLIHFGKSVTGPTPQEILDIPVTSISTFVLLMSSFMFVLSLAAHTRGDYRAFRTWVLCTAILGATFLGFQVFEFQAFAHEGLTPRTNLFGTTFFTLTGFHGAHVTIGVVWLLSLFILSLRGKLGADKNHVVDIAGLYWHFVDIVWIVIFTVVYLSGVAGGQ
ncbi:MAG: cytochrome oxidase subunit III [Dehalococcoidia bacterium]|nr:cytochrome oxidase subunit III [Dehalococcoidia bacterium]